MLAEEEKLKVDTQKKCIYKAYTKYIVIDGCSIKLGNGIKWPKKKKVRKRVKKTASC
jgi:hypothetical protein